MNKKNLISNVFSILLVFVVPLSYAKVPSINKHSIDDGMQKKRTIPVDLLSAESMKLSLPEAFGKTHFIVGMSEEEMRQMRQQQVPQIPTDSSLSSLCKGQLCHAFFSPR